MNSVASLQFLFSFLVSFLSITCLLSYLWFLFRENWRSHQLEKSILISWTLKQLLQIIPTEKTYLKKIFSKVSFPRRLEISAQLDFAIFFCACVHALFHLFNLIELMNAIHIELVIESQIRLALIDFLKGLVEFDPAKRWSPFQVIDFVLLSTLAHLSN